MTHPHVLSSRPFASAKRIVIKIGSSLVVGAEGQPHSAWLESVAEDVAALRAQKKDVLLVTSGAVALGRGALGLSRKKLKLEEKQAAAACGQVALIQAWQAAFAGAGLKAAQILLSIEDSEHRRRFLNARSTLETLLKSGIIPIINENDTVATAELRFGDNDRLAARVAQMAGADMLVLLSDIDGMYTANPRVDKAARHIPEIAVIDETVERMAGGSTSDVGSGGMITKVAAAKIASASGCHTVIALGGGMHPLRALAEGTKCTVFVAHDTPQNARKRWIAHSLSVVGEIRIDEGAEGALRKGRSLLPAGVREVRGHFQRGDAVVIMNLEGKKIGQGISAYSSEDANKIKGLRSAEIEGILGISGREELVHRDDLVVL